ncbi:hypothetical protein CVS40_12233 [Lucilia cuprina]|nr:hypothetical protein CVS40_12233 [Lucilia cuprina]
MIYLVINVFVICLITTIQAKPQYIVDVIDIEWNVTTKNKCDMEWQISQPTRGTFAVSGFFEFKEDINTDNAKGWGVKWPFRDCPIELLGMDTLYR